MLSTCPTCFDERRSQAVWILESDPAVPEGNWRCTAWVEVLSIEEEFDYRALGMVGLLPTLHDRRGF